VVAAELTERLFRRSAGRLVAHLTRSLGTEHLGLAEDAVQDAMLRALQTWPFNGFPADPEAWLFRVARNRALDELRQLARRSRALDTLVGEPASPPGMGGAPFVDDQLTMMFLACHPALSEPMRVGLTLKVVAGFGVDEIAAAFLVPRGTIQQRLVRAKRVLRATVVPFAMPHEQDLPERLRDVLAVLYLAFNEGYAASAGDAPVRGELCIEAIHLGTVLAEHPVTNRPEVHALVALMILQASRLPARVDSLGALVLLDEQNRELWDRAAIARGFRHLEQAAAGDCLTSYHLEAGIASCHAMAPSVADTDWSRILAYYDQLLEVDHSPVVRLNRAVAVAMVHGPEAGIRELAGLDRDPRLRRYHLLPAVRARLLERAGRAAEAARGYARAAKLARTTAERDLMERRLASLSA
jgi:RNA polymerase sigma-70 factor (ECF subfamily)